MQQIILFNKNYRKIAFTCGNKELFVSRDRYQGYKEALQKQDSSMKTRSFFIWFMLEDNFIK